jgi:hypothetical protein
MSKTQDINAIHSRRGLLGSVLRWGAAMGAAAGGLALFKRNRGPISETECRDPEGRTGCKACGLMASCGLPRGLSFKQVTREADNG